MEPFRCTTCGESAAHATRCPRCGGRSFTLARPPAPRLLELAGDRDEEDGLGELIPLDEARSRRREREQPERPAG